MRRQYHDRLRPKVATHFPSLSGRSIDPNVHMFIQDVQLAVMPIGGKTTKQKDFAVNLQGETSDCERARYLIGEIGEYNRRVLSEMVCDAINRIATHLAWEGCAAYEILPGENGTVTLHSFTTKRLYRLPGFVLQIIPRGDWELWEKKVVRLSNNKIWYFEMPSVLGGRKGYQRTLKRLTQFDQIGPPFWRQDLEQGKQSQHFDFQTYINKAEIYFRRATKVWGWNRRDWSQRWSVEFFSFYKMVTFRWAQAILREHILSEINRLFFRLGISCELLISGLPTSSQISQARRELQEGTISFAKASDRVSL